MSGIPIKGDRFTINATDNLSSSLRFNLKAEVSLQHQLSN